MDVQGKAKINLFPTYNQVNEDGANSVVASLSWRILKAPNHSNSVCPSHATVLWRDHREELRSSETRRGRVVRIGVQRLIVMLMIDVAANAITDCAAN